jgi:hypothetical protein
MPASGVLLGAEPLISGLSSSAVPPPRLWLDRCLVLLKSGT